MLSEKQATQCFHLNGFNTGNWEGQTRPKRLRVHSGSLSHKALAASVPGTGFQHPELPDSRLTWMTAFRSPVKSLFGENWRSCGSKPTPGRSVPKQESRRAVETPLCADTQRPQLVGLGVLLLLGTAVGCLKGQVKPSWDTAQLQLSP